MVATKSVQSSLFCFSETHFRRLFACNLYLFIHWRNHQSIPQSCPKRRSKHSSRSLSWCIFSTMCKYILTEMTKQCEQKGPEWWKQTLVLTSNQMIDCSNWELPYSITDQKMQVLVGLGAPMRSWCTCHIGDMFVSVSKVTLTHKPH